MHAVIMAGGSGTRFWPASRKDRPKQFLPITGSEPMALETCNRLAPVSRDGEITLIMGEEHLPEADVLFKGRDVHLIGEPVGRNTAPCIGLGALHAERLGCSEPVAFMPADHYIADVEAFLKALETAWETVVSGGIATLGIVPTRPETGFGYIRKGDPHSSSLNAPVFRVDAFVEKPDMETALNYLQGGGHLWNAGIFVATPEAILKEIKNHLPNLFAGLERLRGSIGTGDFPAEMKEVYNGLEAVSFDVGVMEKTSSPVYVVPADCGWSDVGSWNSVYELRRSDQDREGNLTDGEVLLEDCRKTFVSSGGGRLVACLGIEGCLVVDTPDALLVADLEHAQDIRRIVDQLTVRGKKDLM